eukprot:m.205984 g.205984  ORF g.205984 m.205984 type:complete len:1169 (-) comp32932_c0_seq1:290-3796(-)
MADTTEETPVVTEPVVEATDGGDTPVTEPEEKKTTELGDDMFAAPPDHTVGEVDDLATLTNLTEETLLAEIQARYANDNIYTFVSDILIAVNPFKQLEIYTPEVQQQYNKCVPAFVPPHVWVIADQCYNNLFSQKSDQCAVISGESGAGKTESAKLVIRHILKLCQEKGGTTGLEQSILEVSPILEALGNAQTVMNDNSSRFGKYTRLLFNEEGAVMGVQLSEYLLEKSRVVEQDPGERNFHMFYYLFADEKLKELMKLTSVADFGNLSGEVWDDNATQFAEVVAAMKVVGFTEAEEQQIYKVLATTLHLANVQFEGDEQSTLKADTEKSIIAAAELLGVGVEELKAVFLTNVNVTRGEVITRHYKPEQAYDCRDALAKCLYGNLFGWIVGRINEMLAPELHQKKLAGGRPGASLRAKPAYEIGVLDIFGFENFENNSFEQVCINLAHEQLQYFFNRHTFKLELEEYLKEGIEVKAITFKDNMPLINMFLGKPIGMLALLDEESTFPKATDQSMIEKFEHNFKDHESYIVPSKSKGYPSFGINHFAGIVEYNATNFLEKNRDNLAGGIVELMQDSKIALVEDVFSGEILETGQVRVNKRQSRMHRGEEQNADENKVHRKSPSLSSQFKTSLQQLVDRMTACFPHFVRCIKPNTNQQKETFIADFVTKQMGYTGVLEATRIRQEGYSWRPTFEEFVQRYKILAFDNTKLGLVKASPKTSLKIIEAAKLDSYHIGSTKLFLKFYHVTELEKALQSYFGSVITSQAAVRAFFARKKFAVLQARKKMNDAERAEHDRRTAEENARRKAEEKADKDKVEALEREKIQHEKEKLMMDAERVEVEMKIAEEKAQEAKALAEIKSLEAQKNEEEQARLRAQQEAEMEALARAAAEARQQKKIAETEAAKLKRDRVKSQLLRREEAEKLAANARARAELEAKAHEEHLKAKEAIESTLKMEKKLLEEKERLLLERLQKAEQEAREMREKSAKEATDAEEAKKKEIEALAEEAEVERTELESRDFTKPTFDLKERMSKICAISSSDVEIEPRIAKGWVSKMGSKIKNWHKRWFVLNIDDQTVKYFTSPSAKKEKNTFTLDDITRCYIPQANKGNTKHTHSNKKYLFVIETPARTFYCEGVNEQSQKVWQLLLNDMADYNQQQQASSTSNSTSTSPTKA